jgi:hypothetical protein
VKVKLELETLTAYAEAEATWRKLHLSLTLFGIGTESLCLLVSHSLRGLSHSLPPSLTLRRLSQVRSPSLSRMLSLSLSHALSWCVRFFVHGFFVPGLFLLYLKVPGLFFVHGFALVYFLLLWLDFLFWWFWWFWLFCFNQIFSDAV